ncbi:MAG TPA: DUF2937 family protein [Beijerinckiaceae bacterium]
MPRIARTLSFAMGLFGALAASQGPEYAQQYRQRLGGAIDEVRREVERFDADAQGSGMGRDQAITRLQDDPDPFLKRRGDAARLTVRRLDSLERQRQVFAEAGSFGRLAALAREADPTIARAAYRDFEPAVPTTTEGLTLAGAGFLAAWLVTRLFGAMMRPLVVRRGRRLRPN